MWLPSPLLLALHSFVFAGVGVAATSTTFREIFDEAAQAHQQYAADLVLHAQRCSMRVISFLYSRSLDQARGNVSIWEMVQLVAICGVVPCLWLVRSRLSRDSDKRSQRRSQGTQSTDETADIQKINARTSTRVESAGKSYILWSIILLVPNRKLTFLLSVSCFRSPFAPEVLRIPFVYHTDSQPYLSLRPRFLPSAC